MSSLSASDLYAALERRYPSGSEWHLFRELRVGTGYGRDREKRIDAFAVRCWGATERIAFELKVSRHDFLRELRNPKKRAPALLLSTQFYFVAPAGLIRLDELPAECGLIEVAEAVIQKRRPQTGTELALVATAVAQAPYRESYPPTWAFLASLARQFDRGRAK